jgi:hypothetical protein
MTLMNHLSLVFYALIIALAIIYLMFRHHILLFPTACGFIQYLLADTGGARLPPPAETNSTRTIVISSGDKQRVPYDTGCKL